MADKTDVNAAEQIAKASYDSAMHVDRPRELPDEAQWQMLEATAELQKREAHAGKVYQAGVEDLAGQYTKELHKVIGSKNVAKYMAARKSHRDKLRAARQRLVQGAETEQQFREYRTRLLADSLGVVKQLGIDTTKLAHVRREMRGMRETLLRKTFDNDSIIAEPPKERKKNQTFHPSYSGWQWSAHVERWYEDSSDDLPMPSYSVVGNHVTGETGGNTLASLSDASDYDEAFAKVRVVQLQWYHMPATGQITARFNSQIVNRAFTGSTENEWGNSEVYVDQRVEYFARVYSPTTSPSVYWPHDKKVYGVLGPPGSLSNFGWEYQDEEQDDHSWSYSAAPGYAENRYPVTIPGVFAAGTWVLVGVGLQNRNWFTANDTGVNSHVTARVWVNEIGIASTGS